MSMDHEAALGSCIILNQLRLQKSNLTIISIPSFLAPLLLAINRRLPCLTPIRLHFRLEDGFAQLHLHLFIIVLDTDVVISIGNHLCSFNFLPPLSFHHDLMALCSSLIWRGTLFVG